MKERWKKVERFEECYKISNFGRLIKTLNLKDGTKKQIEIKPVKVGKTNFSFLLTKPGAFSNKQKDIELYEYRGRMRPKGSRGKRYTIQRLVAMHFMKNFNENLDVTHKDGDQMNNKINNLHQISKFILMKQSSAVPVIQKDLNDKILKKFNSVSDAGRSIVEKKLCKSNSYLNATSNIHNCLSGKTKTAYNFKWEYIR